MMTGGPNSRGRALFFRDGFEQGDALGRGGIGRSGIRRVGIRRVDKRADLFDDDGDLGVCVGVAGLVLIDPSAGEAGIVVHVLASFVGGFEVGSLVRGESVCVIENELRRWIVASGEGPAGDIVVPEFGIDQEICAHVGVGADGAGIRVGGGAGVPGDALGLAQGFGTAAFEDAAGVVNLA